MKVISKPKTIWGFTALAYVALAGCTEPAFQPYCYVVPQTAPVADQGQVADHGKMAGHAPAVRQIVMCLKPQVVAGTISHSDNDEHSEPNPETVAPLEGSASSPGEGALAVYDDQYSDTTDGAQAFEPQVGVLSVNARNLRDRLDAVREGRPE